MRNKTQKRPKPNLVRTRHYYCAYVRLMAVLIIFLIINQTVRYFSSRYFKVTPSLLWRSIFTRKSSYCFSAS